MPNQITLPNLGENIESGDVLSILVSEGEVVKKNQDLIEVETDKATMPVPSPAAGKIIKILISEGDTVKIGAALMEIDAAGGAESKTEEKPAAKKEEPKTGSRPLRHRSRRRRKLRNQNQRSTKTNQRRHPRRRPKSLLPRCE